MDNEFPCSRARTLYTPTVSTVLDRYHKLQYAGIIAALILPNPELNAGLLPVRLKQTGSLEDQVFYPACYACAVDGIHGCLQLIQCCHSVYERALRGTWTTLEVQFAIDNGYQLLCVYQVVLHNFYPFVILYWYQFI